MLLWLANATLVIFCCCSAIVASERKEQVTHKSVYSLSRLIFFFPHSSDKKLFHVVLQLLLPLTKPLSQAGGGGEFVRLIKMPFWPTYNFVQRSSLLPLQAAPRWHQIYETAVNAEDDSFTRSSNRTSLHTDPGNPRQLSAIQHFLFDSCWWTHSEFFWVLSNLLPSR